MSDVPLRTLPTACPICEDGCSLQVTTRAGNVVELAGDRRNPATAGLLCRKVRYYDLQTYCKERLLRPGVRVGPKGQGAFRAVSWNYALDLVAAKLQEAIRGDDPAARWVVSDGRGRGLLNHGLFDERLWRRLRFTRLEIEPRRTTAERLVRLAGIADRQLAPEDFADARLIVVWGFDPHVGPLHLIPPIRRAQKAGAKLVVVDPRRIPLCERADLHVQLRPGSDDALARTLLRAALAAAEPARLAGAVRRFRRIVAETADDTPERAADICGVPVAQVRRLIELYRAEPRAALRIGTGPLRGTGAAAVAALLLLPTVADKWRHDGGGVLLHHTDRWKLRPETVHGVHRSVRTAEPQRPLAQTLAESDRVRLLMVDGANPLADLPDQTLLRRGLAREDLFTVVVDSVLTDTARYADVILPTTTFLEHDDLIVPAGTGRLQRVRPVTAPPGQACEPWRIYRDLCHRMNLHQTADGLCPAGLIDRIAAEVPNGFRRRMILGEAVAPPRTPVPVRCDATGWPWSWLGSASDGPAPAAVGRCSDLHGEPLTLILVADENSEGSRMAQIDRTEQSIRLHPADAAARGIAHRGRVLVRGWRGHVVCLCDHDKTLRPGVAAMRRGLWSHATANGNTAMALISTDQDATRGWPITVIAMHTGKKWTLPPTEPRP